MHLDEFFAPRILIVAGKGGVGKTTVAAGLALVAARRGRRVCLAEVDPKGSLARLLGGRTDPLRYRPAELTPGVWGMNIVPEDALAEYLEVQYHIKRLSKAFTSSHFVDYITTAAPGLKDILVLGKIWYLEKGRSSDIPHDFDTIIVDAPAAGHMLTFLGSPLGLSDAVRVGPIKRQADWLVEMLQDPSRTRVHLVTLAEEMPVAETLETADALRHKLGIDAGPVFANSVYSKLFTRAELEVVDGILATGNSSELIDVATEVGLRLDDDDVRALLAYARFLSGRRAIQSNHLRALKRGIDEPVIELPFLFSAGLSLVDIENLADVMETSLEKL
jgi:anion-transporting  ArsA/GET3 family ATPase